jgi:hypothetical protein
MIKSCFQRATIPTFGLNLRFFRARVAPEFAVACEFADEARFDKKCAESTKNPGNSLKLSENTAFSTLLSDWPDTRAKTNSHREFRRLVPPGKAQ